MFDATYRIVRPGVMIENLQELTIKTSNAHYKIPNYNAHFEGTIMMGGEEDRHFDLRFSKLTQTSLDVTKPNFRCYLSGRNKLEASYSALSYKLTKEERGAIDKRNRTFHGHLTND